MSIVEFVKHNYHSFNAGELARAADALKKFLDNGNKLVVSMGGALSTAGIGITLSSMIKAGKVHAVSCTGANLEEDVIKLIAGNEYKSVSHRSLPRHDEIYLRDDGFNRITDTCIPESAYREISLWMEKNWCDDKYGINPSHPYEWFYRFIEENYKNFDYDRKKDSWVVAAYEKKLPIYTPGWEDSSLGNIFSAAVLTGKILHPERVIKAGYEQMVDLARWYSDAVADSYAGYLQLGGGIAGDFAICVVPMLIQDVTHKKWLTPSEYNLDIKKWRYFCQVSDSPTSYGSYSGAPPSEKITWWKLDPETPSFMIESDATIVAPIMFSYVLENE